VDNQPVPWRPATAIYAEYKRDLFRPLEEVTRPILSTKEVAYYLNRKPQTVRTWACNGNGPIRPLPRKGGGPLDWATPDVKRLAGITGKGGK
jgi:hypothetical protein